MTKRTENKKKRYIILALLLLLISMIIAAIIFATGKKETGKKPVDNDQIVIDDDKDEEPKEEEKEEENKEPQNEEPKEEEKPSKNTSTTKPKPTPPAEKPVEAPTKTDPTSILNTVLSNMASLKGDSKKAESISNPVILKLEVSDTEDVPSAASRIVNAIKSKLGYNEATADGTVPLGNPNPFSYDYRLVYSGSENGKHYFNFEYRYRQYYNVADKGYDTDKLVADIVSYLEARGKTKFDYQTSDTIADSCAVVVSLEDDYSIALEKVKALTSSLGGTYRKFDFAYRALTIAGRGQNEATALQFYIYYK